MMSLDMLSNTEDDGIDTDKKDGAWSLGLVAARKGEVKRKLLLHSIILLSHLKMDQCCQIFHQLLTLLSYHHSYYQMEQAIYASSDACDYYRHL